MTSRVCIATIGAAHGTGGEVRLWPHTGRAEDVAAYGPLEAADASAVFEIVSLRPGKGFMVARLKGIADRTAAERLCNTDLYVPRARLPAPAPDEYYHADLIGLVAQDAAGRAVGTVTAVHNFGAGDILEIAPAAGGETVMQPFSRAAVPSVDVAGGHLVVAFAAEDAEDADPAGDAPHGGAPGLDAPGPDAPGDEARGDGNRGDGAAPGADRN